MPSRADRWCFFREVKHRQEGGGERSGTQEDIVAQEGRSLRLNDKKGSRVVGLKKLRMRLFMEVENKAGAVCSPQRRRIGIYHGRKVMSTHNQSRPTKVTEKPKHLRF